MFARIIIGLAEQASDNKTILISSHGLKANDFLAVDNN